MKKSDLYYGTLLLCILSFSQQALSQTLTLTPSNYNGFNISCAGFADGSINMTITGGTPPYTIRWSNDRTSEDIIGLQAGYYSVEVDDSDPFTDFVYADITLTEPEPLNIIELVPYEYQNGYNVSQYGACNGSVTANVTGGVTPYTYIWQPGNQTIYNPTNLCGNENQISVTDNNGCIIASGIGLREPERDDWTMSGNYNSNPANFIGTIDNKDLIFKTNNVEAGRIKANGEFSIQRIMTDRIVSSDSLLGEIKFGDNTLIIQTLTNRIFGDPNGNVYKGTGIGSNTSAKGQHSFVTGYGSMTDINATSSIVLGNNLGTHSPNTFVIGSGFGNQATGKFINDLENSIFLGCNSNIPTMTITSSNGIGTSGTVGIGIIPNSLDNSNSYKLVVNGKLGATEAWVSIGNPWPDYVFDKNYELLNIEQLVEFIEKHKHLPGLPSSHEMENVDKMNLGDLQLKSLEKIEELYLYIFQLKNEIDSLKAEIARISN
ncbi:MAG: SprB repeat-containing protein [Bacteroidetes bacterium]|nr:SprB repeat-containing protein [Bacteroidota bacterium]MBK8416876.1 SprB repeat-containing protein [Bacteroidota bacterium]MBK9045424.1 SprB repeat-containing protein [Bacteroidota bacterium]MBK9423846.1 SprB repeat-containing protein [Bacteroidota bacterium]MBL0072795.1 SprB repeat-containing protein [Bacteroidota bacterium]